MGSSKLAYYTLVGLYTFFLQDSSCKLAILHIQCVTYGDALVSTRLERAEEHMEGRATHLTKRSLYIDAEKSSNVVSLAAFKAKQAFAGSSESYAVAA